MSGSGDRLLSPTEAAKIMGCSRHTVNGMLSSGEIPFVMVGKRRKIPMSKLYGQLGLQCDFDQERTDDDERRMA